MGKRLDTWLDEECRFMTIALSMTPENPSEDTMAMVAEFSEAMKRSYRGQRLLIADQFEELWATVPRWLRWWPERLAWLIERLDKRSCCLIRKR